MSHDKKLLLEEFWKSDYYHDDIELPMAILAYFFFSSLSSVKTTFSLNIYAMAESIDFKFGTQSRWPIRPIIKSHKLQK